MLHSALLVLVFAGSGWVSSEVVEHVRLDSFPQLTFVETPGPRVLAIGDSHMNGTFGTALHRELTSALDARVTVVGSCGRWANAWIKGLRAHCGMRSIRPGGSVVWGKGCARNPCQAGDKQCKKNACRTPRLAKLLRDIRPDITVVQLGGNSIFRSTVKGGWKKVRPYVEQIAQTIVDSGSQCLWVTPPHGLLKSRAKMGHFHNFIREATADRCQVFDSSPGALAYLDYAAAIEEAGSRVKSHDSIHYDRLGKAGKWRLKRWARDVAQGAVEVRDSDSLLALGQAFNIF